MSTSGATDRRQVAIWSLGALAWIGIIFFFSSQPRAGDDATPTIAYKLAHLIEYGVLGILLAGATRRASIPGGPGWAWVIVVVNAVGDEIHQAFVPGRTPLVTDVAIDALGGLVGILAYVTYRNMRMGQGGFLVNRRGSKPRADP